MLPPFQDVLCDKNDKTRVIENKEISDQLYAKKEYAEDLMAGKLFMQPARCYHNLPLGQDDEKEGWLVSSAKIYLTQKRLSGLFLAIEQFLGF